MWLKADSMFAISDTDETKDAKLQLMVDSAEAEFAEYVVVDADTITAALENHLINIIRKHAFDIMNGHRPHEFKPQIIRDYERSLERLESYQAGYRKVPVAEDSTDSQLDVSVTNARPKKFDTWFTDPD